MRMALNLSQYDRMLKSDLGETLEKIAASGFRNVEIASSHADSDPQFAQALGEAGLDTISVHVELHDLRARFAQNLEYAGVFGAEWIVIPVVQIDEYGDGWEKLGAELATISQAVEEAGKKLAYHTGLADFRVSKDIAGLTRLYSGSGKTLNIEFDLNAAAKSKEDAGVWLSELDSHVPLLLMETLDDALAVSDSDSRAEWSRIKPMAEAHGVQFVVTKIKHENGDWYENLVQTHDSLARDGLTD